MKEEDGNGEYQSIWEEGKEVKIYLCMCCMIWRETLIHPSVPSSSPLLSLLPLFLKKITLKTTHILSSWFMATVPYEEMKI